MPWNPNNAPQMHLSFGELVATEWRGGLASTDYCPLAVAVDKMRWCGLEIIEIYFMALKKTKEFVIALSSVSSTVSLEGNIGFWVTLCNACVISCVIIQIIQVNVFFNWSVMTYPETHGRQSLYLKLISSIKGGEEG